MKKRILITLACISAFLLGFAFKSATIKTNSKPSGKKVTSIGGN
jgi:hypothetical protein